MDTEERSKKRLLLWSRAVVHFSLCFAFGVFAALVPPAATGAPSIDVIGASFRPTVAAATPPLPDLDLLLVVTVARPDEDGMSLEASLTRLGNTLRLVAPPLLWIVVGAENRTATARAVHALRGTGVMFRHLTYAAENFTGRPAGDEVDYQRNVALSHIQLHRLPGVVHFAGASSVYDLRFFEQLRRTRGIAAWPIATVSSSDQTVKLEGPTCSSSQITGWYSEDLSTNTTETTRDSSSSTTQAAVDTNASNQNSSSRPPEINISGVGFKSSMLWDSERFIHREKSTGINQDLIQLVRQMVTDDEDKRRGIPSDCSESQIMLWHLDMPRYTPKIEDQEALEKESPMKVDEEVPSKKVDEEEPVTR
ncbi:probable glucuronosyltransferase Os01g0157700 [Oryza brachyantha]|uniref:Glycosyltransferases n=1 Tax=Oryza brachyantha TaxID=4533 RepID=J3KWL1_ORYBR|nr:probable glucuronosyltransferase Os01g0157700 [Oryza brachyantha]